MVTSSGTSSARATANFFVRGCKLNRRQLEKLVRAMREGAPTDATLKFRTERAITTYEAGSIQGLADALATSTEPGDPEILNNLEVIISHYNGSPSLSSINMVRISIHDRGVRCVVNGEPAWVRGKIATLRPLVEELRPFKWAMWYIPRISYVLYGGSIGSWVSWVVNFATSNSAPTANYVLLASFLGGSLIGFVVGGFMTRKSRVEVWLTRDDFPQGYWRFSANEIVTAIIAILGLIAAVVFGVTAHKDARADNGKSFPSVKLVKTATLGVSTEAE